MKKNVTLHRMFAPIALTLMFAMLTPVIANAQAGKADFTGKWALNQEKSKLGENQGFARMLGGDVIVSQEANLLTVERTRTNQNGESVTTTMKYTLDGKESINTSQRGDSKSVATWSADGKSLSIATSRTFDMNGEKMTMKSTEVWSRTDAGTLSVNSTRQGRDGEEIKIDLVYDKK
jgi:Tol biopolymer transport system component